MKTNYPHCLRVRSYIVEAGMEDDCPKCGQPVERGDTGFEVGDADDMIEAGFCTKGCARSWAAAFEEREAL